MRHLQMSRKASASKADHQFGSVRRRALALLSSAALSLCILLAGIPAPGITPPNEEDI